MSLANLYFSENIILVSRPLHTCKHNLQVAKDKEDCGLFQLMIYSIQPKCGLRIEEESIGAETR